jgi:tripartite-type tricarboxylate transporter receptor subunit TctC
MNLRLRALALFSAACWLAGFSVNAPAQEYPSRLIRIVVASGAGGPVDLTGRLIAHKLSESWKQPVIVENRVGASEIIGTEAVAKSKPDGYTLLIVANPFTVNPAVFPKLPYDPVRSFETVTMLTQTPMALVANPKAPFGSVKQLVAYAKAHPGDIAWASAGVATMNHITGEQFAAESGIKILHVPYKDGSPAAANGVIGGDTQFGIVGLASAMPFVQSGRLRVLAVTTAKRTALAPEVPSLAELGFAGIDAAVRVGMYAPAGTPKDVIAKLNAEVNRILQDPGTRQQMANIGADTYGTTTPEEHRAIIDRIAAQIAKIVQQANIRLE